MSICLKEGNEIEFSSNSRTAIIKIGRMIRSVDEQTSIIFCYSSNKPSADYTERPRSERKRDGPVETDRHQWPGDFIDIVFIGRDNGTQTTHIGTS